MTTVNHTAPSGIKQSKNVLPIRGKKRKEETAIPLLSKYSVNGYLQENLLTLLAFDTDAISEMVRAGVTDDLFESEVYRTVAKKSLKYFRKYGKAPGNHLPDLLENFLVSKKRSQARLYADTLNDMKNLSQSINRDFVLNELDDFVRQQEQRRLVTEAAESIQCGDVQATDMILKKGVEKSRCRSGDVGPLPGILTGQELAVKKFPEYREIVYPILQDPGIMLIAGQFGVGKTMISLGFANAISAGENFLGLDISQARSVLYLDLELAGNALRQRDRMIASKGKRKISYWSASNCYPAPIPNFADLSQIDALVDACDPYDIVFIDPISAATSGVDMNTGEAWEGPLQFAMRRRHAGKSTIIVQHVGKDKSRGPRGSSRQEDFVDSSLMLEKIAGANNDSAVRMTCRKLRNHPESDFTPMEIQFVHDGDRLRFEYRTLRESKSELVATEYRRMLKGNLIKKGTQAALCREFKLDKSTVSRIASKVTRQYRKEKK